MSKLWISFCLLVLASLSAHGENDFGAGIVIGDPTGLTAKLNLSKENAVDMAVAWSDDFDVYLHSTFIWHMPPAFAVDQIPVYWFFGFGGRVINFDHDPGHDHDDDTHFGPRAPIGLRLMFKNPRVEVFSELSLAMDLIPEIDADLDFGIGVRYYF